MLLSFCRVESVIQVGNSVVAVGASVVGVELYRVALAVQVGNSFVALGLFMARLHCSGRHGVRSGGEIDPGETD